MSIWKLFGDLLLSLKFDLIHYVAVNTTFSCDSKSSTFSSWASNLFWIVCSLSNWGSFCDFTIIVRSCFSLSWRTFFSCSNRWNSTSNFRTKGGYLGPTIESSSRSWFITACTCLFFLGFSKSFCGILCRTWDLFWLRTCSFIVRKSLESP